MRVVAGPMNTMISGKHTTNQTSYAQQATITTRPPPPSYNNTNNNHAIEPQDTSYDQTYQQKLSRGQLLSHHKQRLSLNSTDRSSSKQYLAPRRNQMNTNVASNGAHCFVSSAHDLPVFVAVEGYQVAAYFIAGEPHLCLPQLLQYLRQKFTLKRMVERFEENALIFTSASAKQVDGFKKASVLPRSAETCPLIKRSDADRICLGLFEQCYRGPKNDIVAETCAADEFTRRPKSSGESVNSVNDDLSDPGKQISEISMPIKLKNQKHNQMSALSNLSTSDTWVQSFLSQCKSHAVLFNNIKQLVGHQANSESLPAAEDVVLFENEAQSSILSLAKAVTSTLQIRVYHKCFGKCVGLFYPSRLQGSRSLCIECASCHIMLTPRRFIGHTHGSKEKDVCHWGFNSYNWRHYIRLSKKQPRNNLDDDELLSKFKSLQLAVDPDGSSTTTTSETGNDDENYEFDKPDFGEIDIKFRENIKIHSDCYKYNISVKNESQQQYNNYLQQSQQFRIPHQQRDRINPEIWTNYYNYHQETELMRQQNMINTPPLYGTKNNESLDFIYRHYRGNNSNYMLNLDHHHHVSYSNQAQSRDNWNQLKLLPPPTQPLKKFLPLAPMVSQPINGVLAGFQTACSSPSSIKTGCKRPFEALDIDQIIESIDYPPRLETMRHHHHPHYHHEFDQYYYHETGPTKRHASDRIGHRYNDFRQTTTTTTTSTTHIEPNAHRTPPDIHSLARYRANSSGSGSSTIQTQHRHHHSSNKRRHLIDSDLQQHPMSHQKSMANLTNLAKCLWDLPLFVTIEGYQVASYPIAGEPHLCLPQLLQYLRQKFTLKRMVDKFEETIIIFTSADPVQVDGFKKACVLPPSAETCPLIKRSDADRICLGLFEQCYRGPKNDIVAETCAADGFKWQPKSSSESVNSANDNISDSERQISEVSMPTNLKHQNHNQISALSNLSTSDTWVQNILSHCEMNAGLFKSFKQLVGHQANSESFPAAEDVVLFENEAQSSILSLAKAVTSTLQIRVYHKCFGKCVGLFYPSRLQGSRSLCIECASCHIMLTPRRFIGHTHGSKEKDVCHWGFNSYNWRHYIRLSKKQPRNNLDDDELLSKFKSLQLAVDPDGSSTTTTSETGNDDENYEFDKPDLDEDTKHLRGDFSGSSGSSSSGSNNSNSTISNQQYHHQQYLQHQQQEEEQLRQFKRSVLQQNEKDTIDSFTFRNQLIEIANEPDHINS